MIAVTIVSLVVVWAALWAVIRLERHMGSARGLEPVAQRRGVRTDGRAQLRGGERREGLAYASRGSRPGR